MEVKGSSSSSSSSSFRWTPTREQVAILEGVYREGIRTPSTEQIQEMTRRLRQFGETEGKNVFYWFQNHKARHRQKIKQQERTAILSRLYRSPPISAPFHHFPPDAVRVATPQPGASCGYYHQTQSPNAFVPGTVIKSVPRRVQPSQPGYFPGELVAKEAASARHETLQLFPLQPSGNVREERSGCSVTSDSFEEGEERGGGSENVPFFNFFGPSHGNI